MDGHRSSVSAEGINYDYAMVRSGQCVTRKSCAVLKFGGVRSHIGLDCFWEQDFVDLIRVTGSIGKQPLSVSACRSFCWGVKQRESYDVGPFTCAGMDEAVRDSVDELRCVHA